MQHPAIVVVTYNRPDSLTRLLGSLSKARYPDGVPLVISIDGGGNRERKVVKTAEEFPWPHGKKKVICHEKNLGLREHILSCGDLTERYDSEILLGIDIPLKRYPVSSYRVMSRNCSILNVYNHPIKSMTIKTTRSR